VGEVLIPGKRSERFSRFFAGYCRRMMRRAFASVRLESASPEVLRSLDAHDGPSIVVINHASWWDPLVGLVLADMFAPSRRLASPIDAEQLARFRFMRRLGLFGLDHRAPGAMEAFVEHAVGLFEREPSTLLGLTPQGEFADVREPIRIRPGVAAVASRLECPRVVSIACEYTFWYDKRPELLIRALACARPEHPTTAGWTRAITRCMRTNADELARLSIARDGSAFTPLLDRAGAGVNPVYDLWLRLRGRSSRISPDDTHTRRTSEAVTP